MVNSVFTLAYSLKAEVFRKLYGVYLREKGSQLNDCLFLFCVIEIKNLFLEVIWFAGFRRNVNGFENFRYGKCLFTGDELGSII